MIRNYYTKIKWVLSKIKHIKIKIFIFIAISLLSIAVTMGETGIQKYIIDGIIGQDIDKSILLITILGAIIILNGMLSSILEYTGDTFFQYPIRNTMIQELLSSVHSMPMKVFKQKKNIQYVDALTQDTNYIGLGISGKMKGISYVLQCITLILILLYINPPILFATFILSVLYLIIGKYFSKKFYESQKTYMEKTTDLHNVIEEGISSTREVLAYNRVRWEKERQDSFFNKYYREAVNLQNIGALQYFATSIFKWSVTIVALIYGAILVTSEKMAISTFIIVYQYCNMLLNNIESVYSEAMGVSGIVARIDRVREMIYEHKGDKEMMPLEGNIESIEFFDVGFRYEEELEESLSNINLRIRNKKKVAFVGPSGGGKSTIAKLLMALYEPTSGTIKINNEDMNNYNKSTWYEKFAICFQEPFMFSDTVKNNLLFGRDFPFEKVVEVCKKMQIHDFIESLENKYDTVIGDRGITISGGQRQRLALARALLHDPDILVLDEATSSLDIATEKTILENIDSFMSEQHKMSVIVAHRLSTIQDADEIFVINDGNVEEYGNHKTLVENAKLYRNLLNEQKALVE